MRAIGVTTTGGPDRLQVLDLPDPQPGPHELVVAVHAATVNPTDIALREGVGIPDGLEPPYVPGMDLAGVVVAVGDGVELSPGDRVVAAVNPRRPQGGAYAERVVVPDTSVALLPDGLDLVAAATLPLNGLTVQRALELADLPPAGTLAVTGAAGAVGAFAVQLAHHRGYRVVADAADEDRELVESLGADTVLPRGDGFAAAVRAAEPGGVDAVLDAALLQVAVLPAVRDGGVLVCVRPFDGEADRGVRTPLVLPADYLHREGWLDEVVRLADDGVLTLRVAQTYPAEQAAEAHRRLEAGGVRGRLVLTF
ncbi:NADP-dependent oxidoreductase [Xylanimonas oleitrophica]|uniref:NADP-dependent oxidoreductase n=1 Tax=Xylanimonas oleitrophica TaxID=2607479 RepID=A0A2W5WVJ0_9MICO|nr:NADP-dependent oxidoreductase [Xylanimonas oleitrophica]PZR55180.1 NADP-dependent oxidoreductase [Xylanimonas oleitrophica]